VLFEIWLFCDAKVEFFMKRYIIVKGQLPDDDTVLFGVYYVILYVYSK